MKKTLINFDVLKQMENTSLSAAEYELTLAEEVVSSVLEKEIVGIRCFNDESVVYETLDGTFIHANYKTEQNHIVFENIEELVINEETERTEARSILNKMVESLLEGDEVKAEEHFKDYISTDVVRRHLNVSASDLTEGFSVSTIAPTKHSKLFRKKQPSSLVRKRAQARKKSLRKRSDSEKRRAALARKRASKSLPHRKGARAVIRWKNRMKNECVNLCENVINYINYKEFGPTLDAVQNKIDEKGNIVALRVPNSKLRNEAKLLSFNWKTLDTKVKVHRNAGKNLAEDANFCNAILDLKKNNAISDVDSIEESIDNIVSKWPNVLYLTQTELSEVVNTALEYVNAKNYDDSVCDFLAEGILRKAYEAYTDRVEIINRLSGNEISEQEYEQFQEVVNKFYPSLDENLTTEMQVFVDLYNTVRAVHQEATKQGNDFIAEEASDYLKDLMATVNNEVPMDLELAEEVTSWLYDLVETNLETSDWNVNKTPHITTSGDHPDMAKKAKQPYTPANDASGNWGDVAPVSDGKNYKNNLASKMRDNAWSNVGGEDTYPSLQNPYVPKSDNSTVMKGENDGEGLAYTSGNTWPELQNPYSPDAPGQDGWRAKNDNLVIDG